MQLLFIFLLLVTIVSASSCNNNKGCRPSGGDMCAIGDDMELLFRLQTTEENKYKDNVTKVMNQFVSYAYCAKVDQLQAFVLDHAGLWGAGIIDHTTKKSKSITSEKTNLTTLDVYGMGPLPSRTDPNPDDDGSVMFFENATSCGGPAVVNFLVVNFTMTKGEFFYNPSVSPLPVQAGFVPTCTPDDICQIDSSSVCIGRQGKKNCATCIQNTEQLDNLKLHVWASYYGTDKNNRRFMSGSDNPVNFKQFSAEPVFKKVMDGVNKLRDL